MEKRGLKVSGFPADDIRDLQKKLDEDFEAEREDRMRKHRELMQRKKLEEEQLRKKRLLERQRAEEEEAVRLDHRVSFWLQLVRIPDL